MNTQTNESTAATASTASNASTIPEILAQKTKDLFSEYVTHYEGQADRKFHDDMHTAIAQDESFQPVLEERRRLKGVEVRAEAEAQLAFWRSIVGFSQSTRNRPTRDDGDASPWWDPEAGPQ